MKKEVLISELIRSGVCEDGEIKGASAEDVMALSKHAGISFPSAYIEFLLAVGDGAGEFLRGVDVFLSAIRDLNEEAVNILIENAEGFTLPSGAFVFLMHQGYEFDYFVASEGSDPPVYQYVEGNGRPLRVWNSFSDFLRQSIGSHAKT
ncbi:SMI1/KNR4 family protein [Pseudoduganella armeniaca]|uniref:SMI1/KNR4 family protein n=1 Tax=Pseudoduganella armeniaca TaxID=2072590 RepID=A0A2R4CCE6_9BURK|nr:SMI1/KNR4 family protein [Pseudoduganella armeniaca]AVR97160.1 SMI1/KNR4 family protein [Pseudoduganella armeniaca]